MGITDKAQQAAEQQRIQREAEALGNGWSTDPNDKRYVPQGAGWNEYEEKATAGLVEITGEDPGPAQRLQPRTRPMEIHGSQYPPQIRREWTLVYRPDDLEIVAWGVNHHIRYALVKRSSNPNEEAMVSPFSSLEDLGEAIG